MNVDKGTLFTCITCRVGFRDADIQRDHYKSDWHRYNLKRKVIDLDPVTAENFAERVAVQQTKLINESSKDVSRYCTVCRKNYGNDKAYSNHLTSKKHVQMSSNNTSCSTASEVNTMVDFGKIEKIGTVKQALDVSKKMDIGTRVTASFFKDDSAVSTEKDSTEAVSEDNDGEEWEEVEGTPLTPTQCLFCEHESSSPEANLEHMSRSHSFFIPDADYCVDVEGLLEYLGAKVGEGIVCLWCNGKGKQFYDVSSVQQHMRDKGHCKILHEGDAIFEYTDFYDYSPSYPDGANVNPDEAYQVEELQFNDNMQLVLPSGITLGHRALKIYYRQYIRPGAQVAVHRARSAKQDLLSKYRAIGYGSNTSLAEAQRKHRDQKMFQQVRDKYYMKLGTTGNKTTQHHFRRQVQF